MKEEIKQYLIDFCAKYDWFDSKEETEDYILSGEIFRDHDPIFREEKSQHRWWNTFFYVSVFDDRLLGYEWAEANRDESVQDLGWDFNPNTVCDVIKKEKIIEYYVPKE